MTDLFFIVHKYPQSRGDSILKLPGLDCPYKRRQKYQGKREAETYKNKHHFCRHNFFDKTDKKTDLMKMVSAFDNLDECVADYKFRSFAAIFVAAVVKPITVTLLIGMRIALTSGDSKPVTAKLKPIIL